MVNIDDIIKRSRYVNLSNGKQEYSKYHSTTKSLLESNIYNFSDKKIILQHWQSLNENQVECFKKIIDILDETFENDNRRDFEYTKSYIINEIAPVVRDAKQVQRYLKYKTTRMKNKITENIKKNTSNIKDTTKALVNNVKDTNQKSISIVKNNVKKSIGKEEVHEAYIQIMDTIDKYNHCDRILENAYNIQKRFNIMNMVESTDINNNSALSALVDSICECVNTYDSSFATRLSATMETCFYFLSRKDKNFNKSLVLEQVVNNFISKDLTDIDLLNVKSIIESSVVFDNIIKNNVEFIYNTIPYEEGITLPTDNHIEEANFVTDLNVYNESIKEKAQQTAKDIVNSFKLAKSKKSTDIRTCVSKMFTKSPDQIIDATPNFLSWLRLSYVVGATAINPVLGGITFLVDQFIAMSLKRRDVSKMITAFKNERKNVAEKLKKTVDEKDKKNLKEYDKYLEKGLEKLKEYEDTLYTEYEKETRDSGEEYDKNKELDFLDDDDDDFGDDFELEATSFEKLFERSDFFSKNYFTNNIKKYISSMNEDTIDTITEVACKYPSIISTNRLYSILNEEYENIKNNHTDSKDWVRMSCLTSNSRKVNPENAIVTSDDGMTDVFTVVTGLEDLFAELSIGETLNPTNESVSTTVKTISNKLRKTMQKLSDTDKEASRRIDSSVNTFVSGMQRAARNDNREAIIRGSILPSASKIVKTAILDTGVALVNPAVAVILAIGQFAVSKKMKKRERQLVLDEIDIELEMCKRYLRQAEDQNDLDAQKKILRIQRNLERQKQRITYNMKMYWDQDVPNTASNDD